MTAKEKADDLINEFYRRITGADEDSYDHGWEDARECALLCVEEIDQAIDFDWMEVQNLDRQHAYWQEVKEAIDNTVFV